MANNGPSLEPLGIYAEVQVMPVSGHKRFFDQFQSRELRDDLARGNLHVTTQYPQELARVGLSRVERDILPEIATETLGRLLDPKSFEDVDHVDEVEGEVNDRPDDENGNGIFGLIGRNISIDKEQGVSGKKKWWTIGISEKDKVLFDRCRKLSAEVVREALPNIRLAEYSPEGYHVSLVKRGNAGHGKLRTRIPPPLLWRITGVSVGVSVVESGGPRSLNYVNFSHKLKR